MTIAIVILMLIGYLLICTEHITHINKATVALFCGVWGWVLYVCVGPYYIETLHNTGFQEFLGNREFSIAAVNEYLRQEVFSTHIAQLTNIAMYLLTTMAIVNVLENNGCFDLIVKICRSRSSWATVWMLALCSFLLSANLDNLTSAVVMLMVMNRLVVDHRQRMLLGTIIVIATNCGGCFTVIGDVTSLLVWTRNAVEPTNYTAALVLPALCATAIPTYLIGRRLPPHLDLKRSSVMMYRGNDTDIKLWQQLLMAFLGMGGLWFVPTFYRLTNLPPFLGALCVLGVLWVVNEIINRKRILSDQPFTAKTSRSLQYEVIQMIMFFLGIGLSVDILIEVGAMENVASWCDRNIHDIYILSFVLGAVSSVLDNVALVISGISIYPVLDANASGMTEYMQSFVQNGQYWHLITLSGCVGGCLLPIGNTAGYALMKAEDVTIWWYIKHITWKVLLGWFAALGIYFLVDYFLR
ncbi:MAG: sodium:proton antiporter [Bacteroidaceae bacterium]|nr:sodium:proton antiporter [Bacteroidaceae bacterium]